jgi:hypothetical protein
MTKGLRLYARLLGAMSESPSCPSKLLLFAVIFRGIIVSDRRVRKL